MADCELWLPGCLPYAEAWALQNALVEQRARGAIADRLLLLEHPHTYTLGSSARREHLLLSAGECAAQGIAVLDVDRGGDITYHGPGQLVGYPIVRLPLPALATGQPVRLKADVVGYVRGLEQVIMNVLAEYGIPGWRLAGSPGVWVGDATAPEKICALGVRVNTKGITKHGFALNVNTDLRYFAGIVPCGIQDKGVTSLARLLGRAVDLPAVAARVAAQFGAVFGCTIITVNAPLPAGNTPAP